MINKIWCRVMVCFLAIFFWLVLSPVSFFGDFNYVNQKISADGKYKVVAYYVLPTTPYAAYQAFVRGDVFVVLYDINGKYLGQSSPFHFSEIEGVFGDTVFFPGEISGDHSFSINGVNDYVDGYTIPVDQKKWWSRFLSVFY